MLSYRHAFHAGNPADVLKHVILVALLDHMALKDKACWFVDTHAGTGVYPLNSGFATQTTEFADGIGRLWGQTGLSPCVDRYLSLVSELNPTGALIRYPGSAWFAHRLLRYQDQLWLYERHPADWKALDSIVIGANVHTVNDDGLRGLRAHLPPEPRRALVLMDPSYEVKAEYEAVVQTLRDALQRFPTGTYALWHPLLASYAAQRLPERLQKLGVDSWLHARLWTRGSDTGPGMWGSGMFVVNPPYTLPGLLESALPELVERLGQDNAAGFDLDWRID